MTDKRFEGLQRGFFVHSEAWYSKGPNVPNMIGRAKEEIWFGFLVPESGSDDGLAMSGEIFLRFYDLHGTKLTPKLEVFHDSWAALLAMPDILEWLGEMDDIGFTPQELVEKLLSMGFIDRTTRENPNAHKITFTITDGCDETGRGTFELVVNQLQLDKMLELGVIYEDTTSDYIGRGWPEPRRHFHPAHQHGMRAVDVMMAFHHMECGQYGDEYR